MMKKIGLSQLEERMTSSTYVVLEFSSPGCAPCKAVSAEVEELAAASSTDRLQAFEVNIAEEPEAARKFSVFGVPTVILFKEGKEVSRFTSTFRKEKLMKLLT